jgi:hypothetical protein
MAAELPGVMLTWMSSTQVTTQILSAAAVAVAMVTAGLSKRRLEWKRRPPRRRKAARHDPPATR